VLPLQFVDGESAVTHGLSGFEKFSIKGISEGLEPRKVVTVIVEAENGDKKEFKAVCRLDTPVEIDYLKNGGILQTVLRQMVA